LAPEKILNVESSRVSTAMVSDVLSIFLFQGFSEWTRYVRIEAEVILALFPILCQKGIFYKRVELISVIKKRAAALYPGGIQSRDP
jgi:hypothetical protein